MAETIFISGASGFIGKRLVATLASSGHQVVCLVRASSDTRPLRLPGVRLAEGVLDQPASYRKSLAGCDLAIHLAALTHANGWPEFQRVNVAACGLLADACIDAGVERLVYLSSLAAAGPTPPEQEMLVEQDRPAPISLYGRSKLQGEQQLRRRAAQLAVTVLRPGVVYGPGDKQIGSMIAAIDRWGWHFAIGRPDPLLSYIHVDDLVTLLLAAARQGESLQHRDDDQGDDQANAQGIYFASDDSDFCRYSEFGLRVGQAMGRDVRLWQFRRPMSYAIGWIAQTASRLRGTSSILSVDKVREATASGWTCSSAKARGQLGFAPARSMQQYLPDVVASYR